MSSRGAAANLIEEFERTVRLFTVASAGQFRGPAVSIASLKQAHGRLDGLDTSSIRRAGRVAARGGAREGHATRRRPGVSPVGIVIDLLIGVAGNKIADFFSREDDRYEAERTSADAVSTSVHECCDAVDEIVDVSEMGLVELLMAAIPMIHALAMVLSARAMNPAVSQAACIAGMSVINQTLHTALSTCGDRDDMVNACFDACIEKCEKHCAAQESCPPAPAPQPATEGCAPVSVDAPETAVETVVEARRCPTEPAGATTVQTAPSEAGDEAQNFAATACEDHKQTCPPFRDATVSSSNQVATAVHDEVTGSDCVVEKADTRQPTCEVRSVSVGASQECSSSDVTSSSAHCSGVLGLVGLGLCLVGAAAIVECVSEFVEECEPPAPEPPAPEPPAPEPPAPTPPTPPKPDCPPPPTDLDKVPEPEPPKEKLMHMQPAAAPAPEPAPPAPPAPEPPTPEPPTPAPEEQPRARKAGSW